MSTAKYVAYTVGIVAGAAVVYLVVSKGKTIGAAVSSIAQSINPASSENIVYRAASSAAAILSGDTAQNASSIPLGTRLWEWMNPAAVAAERVALRGQPDKSGAFLITHDDDGNLIGSHTVRSSPVPSGSIYDWGPMMSDMQAP